MSKKRIILVAIAAAVLGYGIYAGISCLLTSEEDRVRELVIECEEIIESGSAFKAPDLEDYLTEDFECTAGIAQDEVPGFIVSTWQIGGKPVLVTGGFEIEVRGETAKAAFRLDVNFPKGPIEGDHAYDMKVECRKVEGDWKISKAEWVTLEGIDPAAP